MKEKIIIVKLIAIYYILYGDIPITSDCEEDKSREFIYLLILSFKFFLFDIIFDSFKKEE